VVQTLCLATIFGSDAISFKHSGVVVRQFRQLVVRPASGAGVGDSAVREVDAR
jgi:hypothetical protein